MAARPSDPDRNRPDRAGGGGGASPREGSPRCWVCGGERLRAVRPSQLAEPARSRDFAITDAGYGRTGALERCEACSFLQCSELADALGYYEELEDPGYEASRPARALQMRRLLEAVGRRSGWAPGARLLDVGAGSGILVEEARSLGLRAHGIEPSTWLHERARRRELPVELGTLPHPALPGPFDVVTLVDVIEHVSDPVGLLRESCRVLAPGGEVVVVTPDLGSWAPRLLGWRWWHFRVAHIGYFDRSTLDRALRAADLAPVRVSRPSWVFDARYLIARLGRYLPGRRELPAPRIAERLRFPLNLRDSLLAVARRAS